MRMSESPSAWFCLRSQPKHEHIAARHLRQMPEVDVFLPRIRFRRKTRHGTVWATEALFPNYLFACFNWKESLRRVCHSPGVAGVIHFGDQWPTIPGELIGELRSMFGSEEIHVLPAEPDVGDEIQIAGGAFHGLTAVVTQVMPARKRVTVLLEFLGRQTAVQVPLENVVRSGNARETLI
jgi:transcriptional antiterminator RfaH